MSTMDSILDLWITNIEQSGDECDDTTQLRKLTILSSFVLKCGCSHDTTDVLHQLALRTSYSESREKEILVKMIRCVKSYAIPFSMDLQLLEDIVLNRLETCETTLYGRDCEGCSIVMQSLGRGAFPSVHTSSCGRDDVVVIGVDNLDDPQVKKDLPIIHLLCGPDVKFVKYEMGMEIPGIIEPKCRMNCFLCFWWCC